MCSVYIRLAAKSYQRYCVQLKRIEMVSYEKAAGTVPYRCWRDGRDAQQNTMHTHTHRQMHVTKVQGFSWHERHNSKEGVLSWALFLLPVRVCVVFVSIYAYGVK